MKKLLLATAAFALLAPAAHAEIKLDLGGYFKGYAGYSDQDTDDLRDFDIKRKSEVFFEGETTLDNGLTLGYHGSLFQEADAGGDAALEESYLYFSGNWGRVNLGRENSAAYLLQVTAPGADANIDGADIDFSFVNLDAANGARQEYAQEGAEGGQYADKITYLTPKFNGFQAGVSYSPEYDTQSTTDAEGGMEADNTPGDLENFIEGSARYDGEFRGVGVHVGGGYGQADDEGGDADFNQYNGGLKLTYEGFGFGGSYISEETDGVVGSEIDTWTVGADYTYGAYNFGASYLTSDNDEDDQFDRYAVGAGYTFGPGMKFNGAVGVFEEEVAGVDGNDGVFVTVGTDIQF